jgi:thioredoxin-like negative regulator of GroEL
MLLPTLLAAAVLGTTPQSELATARDAAVHSGRPLLVLVGAAWCGPCQKAKLLTPSLRTQGVLAVLDIERDVEAAAFKVKTLPTLIVYEKTPGGWKPPRYIVGIDAIAAFAKERK